MGPNCAVVSSLRQSGRWGGSRRLSGSSKATAICKLAVGGFLPRQSSYSADDVETAHVRTQRLWHPDGAVLLLVILEDRHHRARQGESGAIQRVHEVNLAILPPIPDVGAAGLEVVVGGAGRHFEEAILPRRPGLEIVGLRLAEAHVAGAEQDDAIRKLQTLEHILGIPDQLLELLTRSLRLDEFHQLDLVELMQPDVAAGVLAGRTRLASKVGRPGHVL